MKKSRPALVLGFAMTVVLLASCARPTKGDGGGDTAPTATPTAAPTATPPPDAFRKGLDAAESLFDANKNEHVAVVLVGADGRAFPYRLIVRKKKYKIVWIPDGEKLDLDFHGALQVDCTTFAPACIAKVAPQNETGSLHPLTYDGTITKNGVATQLDPHLEVVK